MNKEFPDMPFNWGIFGKESNYRELFESQVSMEICFK
jgi:hypothetical protein